VVIKEEKTIDFLKIYVSKFTAFFRRVEYVVLRALSHLKPVLPEENTFIHTEETGRTVS